MISVNSMNNLFRLLLLDLPVTYTPRISRCMPIVLRKYAVTAYLLIK